MPEKLPLTQAEVDSQLHGIMQMTQLGEQRFAFASEPARSIPDDMITPEGSQSAGHIANLDFAIRPKRSE